MKRNNSYHGAGKEPSSLWFAVSENHTVAVEVSGLYPTMGMAKSACQFLKSKHGEDFRFTNDAEETVFSTSW